jgi:hypothetical protein
MRGRHGSPRTGFALTVVFDVLFGPADVYAVGDRQTRTQAAQAECVRGLPAQCVRNGPAGVLCTQQRPC